MEYGEDDIPWIADEYLTREEFIALENYKYLTEGE